MNPPFHPKEPGLSPAVIKLMRMRRPFFLGLVLWKLFWIGSLIALVESYFAMKGQHVQFHVVSAETLREAGSDPEHHRDLRSGSVF